MVKVYVVTSGEYSDYGINAMFTKKETATDYAELCAGDVEEWEIDKPWEAEFRHDVCMNVDDGMNASVRVSKVECGGYRCNRDGEFLLRDKHGRDVASWYVTLYYKIEDNARAIKVANEKRIQYVANGGVLFR